MNLLISKQLLWLSITSSGKEALLGTVQEIINMAENKLRRLLGKFFWRVIKATKVNK